MKESAAVNLAVTSPVKPFKVCYDADEVMSTRIGPAVPTVDLVLGSGESTGRIRWSGYTVMV